MTTPTEATDLHLLLNAYVDGELDAASALSFESRLAADPELVEARDRMLALRRSLRDALPLEKAPARLLQAMAEIAAPERAQAGTARPGMASWMIWFSRLAAGQRLLRPDWVVALAGCLVGALLGAGVTALLMTSRWQSPARAEVVADHLRAIMAPQPFDIASSDQHNVKPWFTGRLSFAPRVFDLSAAGFALIGGRVDVIGGEPAAALVFRHGKHLISLLSQPIPPNAARAGGGAADRGFQVRDWMIGEMRYWAVSDVAPDELDAFETAVKAELAKAD